MSVLVLRAPLAGWCLALDEVPDPVFAQRMAGDGLAIDPTLGVLHAPCDGEVVTMGNARHAVTVRAAGMDILMHVGIDTVELDGFGFELLVAAGQRVRSGEPLLRFDMGELARRAKSLASPVVIASGGTVARRAAAGVVAVGDFLMEVTTAQAVAGPAATAAPAATAGAPATREEIRVYVIPFDHGLHARPAAQVAAALRPFAAQVTLTARGRSANARSTVALMTLGARCGDEVQARATGADAAQALDALGGLLAARTGVRAPAPAAPQAVPARIEAAIASRGLALGPCVPWTAPEIAVEERGAGEAHETQALEAALAAVVAALEALQREAGGEAHALLAAHIELARDPDLRERAWAHLGRGQGAGHAWRQATRATAEVLLALDDERMRERAADLRDLENQVLRVLAGKPPGTTREFPPGAIVVAEDLLPSQMMALERARVGGICTARGGATSHAAILAAAAGMPALVAAGDAVLGIAEGTPLALDAEHGWLDVDPSPSEQSALERKIAQRRTEGAADLQAARRPRHHARRRAHHGECQPRVVRRGRGRGRPWRGGLRPAAHRIPVPRPARSPDGGRARARVPAHRRRPRRPRARHPHHGRGRRQAHRLPALRPGGESRAGTARHPREPRAPAAAARPAARDPARAPRWRGPHPAADGHRRRGRAGGARHARGGGARAGHSSARPRWAR